MKLYMMRHGETDWNKQGRIQGSADIPLNDYGIALAEQTRDGMRAEGIHFDHVFTSPYVRARETARIIGGVKEEELKVRETIREMSFGSFEGVRLSEVRTNPKYHDFNLYFEDPVHYVPQGTAESYKEVFSRTRAFLKEDILPLEGQCEAALVVCHGAILRALLSIIGKLPLEEYWNIHQPNCSVNLAQVSGGEITMIKERILYYHAKHMRGGIL